MAQDRTQTDLEDGRIQKQESVTGENREKETIQTENNYGKTKVNDGPQSDIEQPPPPPSHRPRPSGRTYYFTIPIRPLTGNIPDELLDRLTLYYTLYGLVFGAVGAIAIVLPLVFGVEVLSLLPWLLVLGGAVTLLILLLICGAPGTTAFLLLSALHISAGVYLLVEPAETSQLFTYLLAGWFLIHGVLKVLMAISVRRIITWPVVLVSGLASAVLALVILILTSSLGIELISIAFGADLAFTGVSLLLISIMGFLGKTNRSVTDAELLNEPFLQGNGQGQGSS